MRAVTKDGFRSLLYLISLVVGVATAGVLVGVGFSWLTDPPLATQTAGPILSAQAPKENEFRLPRGNGTAGGPLPDIPAEKVAASSLPDAPSNSAALALGMPAMKARHTPSGAITGPKGRGSIRIAIKELRDIGRSYGHLMPAPDQTQAAAFTALQTALSGT